MRIPYALATGAIRFCAVLHIPIDAHKQFRKHWFTTDDHKKLSNEVAKQRYNTIFILQLQFTHPLGMRQQD